MATPNHYSKANARKLGYRSGFEVSFAEELEALGVEYEYESDACIFRYHKPVSNAGVLDSNGCPVDLKEHYRFIQWCSYTCDFMLRKGDGTPLYIETKGRFLAKDRAKHRLIKKQFPDVDLRILFSQNAKVSDKSKCLDWAAQFNIPAEVIVKPTKKREGRYIPREWLVECDIPFQS